MSKSGSNLDLLNQKIKVTTPDDGRCMFFAIANSILIPLLDDEKFITEFQNLFPNQEQETITNIRNLLRKVTAKYSVNPNSQEASDILKNDKNYGFLIQNLRERVVQTMYDNIIGNEERGIEANPEYYSGFNVEGVETINEAYLERMRSPTQWAGNHELVVISELLGKRIKLPTITIQRENQELPDANNPIVEIYYNGQSHYEAMLDSRILNRSGNNNIGRHDRDDDSSDDEAVTTQLFGAVVDEKSAIRSGGYDLDAEWTAFCRGDQANASESFEGLTEEEKAAWYPSFLLHAFGIGMLYSQKVNRKYYGSDDAIGLKKKYLSDIRKRDEVKALVEKNLNKIVSLVADIFFDNLSQEGRKEALDHIKSKLTDSNSENLKDMIDLAASELAVYLKDKACDKKEIKFIAGVKHSRLQKEWQLENDYYKDGKGNINKCKGHVEGWELLEDGVWAIFKKKKGVDDIVKQLEIDGSMTSWNGDNKTNAVKQRRYYLRDTHSTSKIVLPYNSSTKEFLRELSCSQHLASMPVVLQSMLQRKLLSIVVPDLEKAEIITENKTESSVTKSPHKVNSIKWKDNKKGVKATLQQRGLYKVAKLLSEKDRITDGRLFEELITGREVLSAYFEDIVSSVVNKNDGQDLFGEFVKGVFHNSILSRKTLPHRFSTDAIEDVVDFLAQIRLSNRSKFREVKNIKDALGREDFLGKDALARIKRYWRFNDGVVVEEEQTISSAAIARDAQVVVLDNRSEGSYANLSLTLYNDVIGKFNQKYPDYKIDDKDIAKWIRNKINGETLELEGNVDIERIDVDKINQFITEFSYLLFGCEVARNPAALPTHQMMLDLIIDGGLKWENCISGQLMMPMAMKEAVKGSRASHSKFKDFMPWPYRYDGDEDIERMNQLVAAEKNLFDRWLEHKKISPVFAEEALLLACNDWYGIEMEDVVYGVNTSNKKRNSAEFLVERWIEQISNNSASDFRNNDYVLMCEILKKSDYNPTSEQKVKLSNAIIDYMFKLDIDDYMCKDSEEEFFGILAQRDLFAFETIREGFYNTLGAIISLRMTSVAKVIIPKLSKEFLDKKMFESMTLLSTAAHLDLEETCKLLIDQGVKIDEETKKTDFYKENEAIFTFAMPDIKKGLENLGDVDSNPSNTSSPLSHSKLSSRSSSRSVSSDD